MKVSLSKVFGCLAGRMIADLGNLNVERSAEEEKQQQKELEEKFKPLTEWLKKEVGDAVRNGELLFYSSG